MKKKKILIISRSFYPQNSPRSFRTTELVKEFARQGHDVTVYIHKNNKEHVDFEKKYGVTIKCLGKKKFSILNIRHGNKYSILFKRVVNRILLQLFEYPDIELMFKVKKALKKESNYDLLISIAVPHTIHWGVAWSRSKRHRIAKTWVADCGDPFMGATLDTFKKVFYFKYLEKWWSKKADFITVPFAGAVKAYYTEFHHKIKIIPQGFNFDEIEINPYDYKQNEIPTFAYSGGFIPGARDPKDFIEYLLSSKKDFKFIIYTRKLDMVMPYMDRAPDKIKVLNYIPRQELIKELSKMDFIVNFNNSNTTQLPSKLIDYYLTKRPVLSLDSSDFNKDIVNQFLLGDYLGQFIHQNPQQYKIDYVCQQFLDLEKHDG